MDMDELKTVLFKNNSHPAKNKEQNNYSQTIW